MKKIAIYSLIMLMISCSNILFAQTYSPGVGINTKDPKRTLDVDGTIISKGANDKWFFENPGIYTGKSNESYLTVIDKDDNKLKVFNPNTMSYAAINYITFRFNRLPDTGLLEYDTKIDASKYHLTVGGFIIFGSTYDTTSQNVTGQVTKIKGNVLYSSRAYVGSGNTWILKFQPNNNVIFNQKRIDLILNVTIYRKNLLLFDSNKEIVVDMENTKTASAPVPEKL